MAYLAHERASFLHSKILRQDRGVEQSLISYDETTSMGLPTNDIFIALFFGSLQQSKQLRWKCRERGQKWRTA
jgi:hypothetical protein